MKKLFLLVFFTLALSVFSAQSINLGDFPLGTFLDDTYSAVWEFNTDNIRILDKEGGVYYDFKGKTIVGFEIMPSTSGLELSFSCKETGKEYTFIKKLTTPNLDMVIDTDTGIHYEIELEKLEMSSVQNQ